MQKLEIQGLLNSGDILDTFTKTKINLLW